MVMAHLRILSCPGHMQVLSQVGAAEASAEERGAEPSLLLVPIPSSGEQISNHNDNINNEKEVKTRPPTLLEEIVTSHVFRCSLNTKTSNM